MRGIVVNEFGGLDVLRTASNLPKPVAGDNNVVVEVCAAGLNFADLLVIEGKYQVLPELPFVPGKEIGGEVIDVGPGVSRFKVGDRVLAFVETGGFAEQAMAAERNCHPIPQSLSFSEAVSLGINFQTSYFALVDRALMQAEDIVLVTGASGGVGSAAVQIAKASGATVLAGIENPEKEVHVRAAGADHVIDLSMDDL